MISKATEVLSEMKITHLKTNHMTNPLGVAMERATVSFVCEDTNAKKIAKARVEVALDGSFSAPVFDSGMTEDVDSTAYALPLELKECTRYFWRVSAEGDDGDSAVSETAWFETPKTGAWAADFITPDADKAQQVCMYKTIHVKKSVERARMYMTGLGLYELYLDGEKVGDECLLPGFTVYSSRIQYQTFELKLTEGEHTVAVLLGDGWYKGRYGLRKPVENYGDRLAMIAELDIRYADGTKEVIATDESWKARPSQIIESSIYDGETWDATADTSKVIDVKKIDLDKSLLKPRLSPKLRVQKELKPVELIHTPAGEDVLDFGQNLVGWISFECSAPKGTQILLQASEILQDGNFYRDNLRTAKAQFLYISDGEKRTVRQHFTFYGYRYMKVTGWPGEIDKDAFTAQVIHSEMDDIGFITTSDPLVNKLFENTKWGQRGNFLDIPTDCPQRDERCGWTGDAQVFSGTACFNMDTYAFYAKYGQDIWDEQKKLGGAVPDTVPVAGNESAISTVWGEAATVIPWNVYLHFGDPQILKDQYASMKGWVGYMKGEDEKTGGKRLWQTGFHYGDWLALDGKVNNGVYGATDVKLIASAYYWYSTTILKKTAHVLGYKEDEASYGKLADEIKDAFMKEYFTPAGRLCVDTMTAYVVVLKMGLVPEGAEDRAREGLKEKLRKNRYHLETGFVGTPFLCRVLSDNGMNELAYHLLLEKGYPGWLYEILMGATTVWERWDSVLPNGKISGTEMNSLNHYSYGSICEWMYRDMLGIVPSEEGAGFKKFTVAPKPNYQLQSASGSVFSPLGKIESGWKSEDGKLTVSVTVPVGAECEIVLPDADAAAIGDGFTQKGSDAVKSVGAGSYSYMYEPTVPMKRIYTIDSPLQDLMENPETKKILDEEFFSVHAVLPFVDQLHTLRETVNTPFMSLPYEVQERMDRRLREV